MNLTKEEFDFFIKISNEIINNEMFISSKKNMQHGLTSVYTHSYNVALKAYSIAVKKPNKYDLASLIRGALLHDFFLYDWHVLNGRKRLHGLHHPKIAYNNSISYFPINKKEKNIIMSHMWPLTLFYFPLSKEARLVNRVDKIVSLNEIRKKEEVMTIWKP